MFSRATALSEKSLIFDGKGSGGRTCETGGPKCLPGLPPRPPRSLREEFSSCASFSLAKLGALGERPVLCVRVGNKVPENPVISWVIEIVWGE